MFDRYAEVRSALRREIPDLVGLYLFGSQVDGSARPDSDVDFAFLSAAAPPRDKLVALKLALSARLGCDVDLVDLARVPTVLQMQVVSEGVVIDRRDANAMDLFELRVLRDYADLKIRRRDIEADIVRRGRVHA